MITLLLFPVVLLSYAGMHVYLGVKLCHAFPRLKPWTAWLIIAVTLLFAAPFLTRWFGNRGFAGLARLTGMVGYTWIAVVFWFFSLGLVLDAWNLLIRLVSVFFAGAARGHLPPRPAVSLQTVFIMLAMVWSLVEANVLRVETVRLPTDRLPAGRTVRLVQISDLHLSAFRGCRVVERIAGVVASLQPDLLVSTGDLLDSPGEALRPCAERLRSLAASGGRYAVLGNHEYFTGLTQALFFYQAAGFNMLRGRMIEAAPGLWLAGVDDAAGSFTRQPHFDDERLLAAMRPAHGLVILLKHQPRICREAGAWFDLQLSGHTHGGQLFPFEWFLKPFYPWRRGLHEVAPGRWLYVSRGAGTWGPPMRLFARPEITLMVLEGTASS